MYSIFWKKSRNTWITSIIFPGGFSVVVGKTSGRDSQRLNIGGCKV